MVHGVARLAPARPRRPVGRRSDRGQAPLAHGRSAAQLARAPSGAVSRALVVLERRLRPRGPGVRGRRGHLVLGSRAGAPARASGARAHELRGARRRGARTCPGRCHGSPADHRRRLPGVAARRGRALVDRRRPAPLRGAPARRPGAALGRAAERGPRAAGRRARRPLLPRLLEPASSRAAVSRSITRGRSAATSRCSCSSPRRRRRSRCSRTAGAAAG